MTIYDYAGHQVEIKLPDKEIVAIRVILISGDETGEVVFSDGERIRFDSSTTRFMDFYDGSYVVIGEEIQRWLAFVPAGNNPAAYERARLFAY